MKAVYDSNVASHPPSCGRAEDEAGASAQALDTQSAPLPIGVCLLIWAAVAGVGWAVIYMALHFL
jgi:hypothetical protein